MTQKEQQKITRFMTIEEILEGFPHRSQKIAQALTSAGLSCVGCGAATWETLEAGMYSHGFDDSAIDKMVEQLLAIVSEEMDLSTITLTTRAAKKYREILDEEGKTGHGLRFDDRAAGCSGFEYLLDFSEKAGENDEVFLSQGIEIHVDRRKVGRLIGSEIDYIDGLSGAGFKISNPNAKGGCGCGKSQSY